MGRLYFILAWATPSLAYAHSGVHRGDGFAYGFFHPFGGADHFLAMLAVGLFAAHLGRVALWLVPSSFVALMVVGAILGANGVLLQFSEIGVAASLVCLGAAYAFGFSAPILVAAALTAFFAIFHGQTHGAEMPANAAGLAFGAGFVAATALLHAAGLIAGLLLQNIQNIAIRQSARRWIGAGVVGAGVWFLVNAF